jgi:hypothetical protein
VANTIQLKRSTVAGAIPSSLADGELAVQRADKTIYFKDSTDAIHDLLNIDCGEILPSSPGGGGGGGGGSTLSLWAAEALDGNWHWSD